MKAILQRELWEAKSRRASYLLAAAYLFVSGLFLVSFNLLTGSANLVELQKALSLCSVLFFPILTAFPFPRERQSGSDAFLLSLPIRTSSIVLGKFLATLWIFFLSLLPTLLVSFCFPLWGDTAAHTLPLWIGFFAESLVLLSLCFFLSTLAKRPAVSFGISIGATLLLYLLWSFGALLPGFLQTINPFSIPGSFSFGRLDLPLFLGGLLLTGLFLFLSTLSLECRRSSLFGAQAARSTDCKRLGALVAAGILILVTLSSTFLPLLPQSLVKPRLATGETYEISAKTKNELAALNTDVTLYFAVDGGRTYADGEIYAFLRSYEELSPKVTVMVVDTKDREFLASHGLEAETANGTVVVESNERFRVLTSDTLYYYKNTDFGFERMSVSEYLTQCNYLEAYYSSDDLYQFVATSIPYFDGESVLSNAIRFVCAKTVPTVCVLNASDTMELDESLAFSLALKGYEIKTVESTASLPSDCSLLLIHSPTKDLSQQDADGLSAYLAAGGKLVLTTYYRAGALPVLESVLKTYGLSFGDTERVVCEGNTSYAVYGENVADYLFFAHVAQNELSANFGETVAIPLAHAIKTEQVEGVTVTPWLYTSEMGYLYDPLASESEEAEGEEETAPLQNTVYTVGAVAQKEGSTVLWLAAPDIITAMGDSFSNGGNLSLFCDALASMTAHTDTELVIDAAPFDLQEISLKPGTLLLLSACLVVLIPIGVIVTGAILRYVRKKR